MLELIIGTYGVLCWLVFKKFKLIPVTTGISDNDHYEIVSGVTEGQMIITGGYRAISKDLEDGKQVRVGGSPNKKE